MQDQSYQKNCPQCHMDFETKTHDKTYCSTRCRNAKHRERERAQQAAKPQMTSVQEDALMYFITPIANPTAEMVVKTAELLIAAQAKKPALFRLLNGAQMPAVTLPPNVTFNPTLNPAEWLMFI